MVIGKFIIAVSSPNSIDGATPVTGVVATVVVVVVDVDDEDEAVVDVVVVVFGS
ncbi:MAG: hypothetical protein R2705_10775 [Ilumatobacteraceae bacterium]